MKKILLDAHMLGARETGNESYISTLAAYLAGASRSAYQILLYTVHPNSLKSSSNGTINSYIDKRGASSIYRIFWGLPHAYEETAADLLHVTYHAPFWISHPYVVTIHDVSYRTRLRFTSPQNILLQNILGWFTVLRARAILTVSAFCKAEIERIYPSARGKTYVTLEAPAPTYRPCSPSVISATKNTLGIHNPFLLWVGKTQSRKNLYRLMKAFQQILLKWPNTILVIAGPQENTFAQRFRHTFESEIEKGSIIVTGYLTQDQLSALYTDCKAFVFPSLYEGFGLPVLEAMACGAPVITSNITALPEVAGNAALLVNPYSTDEIASTIDQLLASRELQASLSMLGKQRAATFTWEATANQTLEIYRNVLQIEHEKGIP